MPLGVEDIMHKSFAHLIRQYEQYGQLNCSWWSYDASGENRTEQTGSLLKAKGLKPGKSDFEFVRQDEDGFAYYYYLEFKTQTGKQSDNQKIFESKCIGKNQKYFLPRSIEQGIKILIDSKIILC